MAAFTLAEAKRILSECGGQDSLIEKLDAGGEWPVSLVSQVGKLDGSYPGGLKGYLGNARALLAASSSGSNPMADVVSVEVPSGVTLDYGSPEYDRLECLGLAELPHACFVLVAGGLGERLGFGGIKLALPVDLLSGQSYLGLYCASILALQSMCPAGTSPLPLVIMTSDDTHTRTEALLADHGYFGLAEGQVRLVKQEKVAALTNNQGLMAVVEEEEAETVCGGGEGGGEGGGATSTPTGKPLVLATKPHGHGDVHLLLHSSGIAKEWLAGGKKWVAFFQDTNALVMRSMAAVLGVSSERGLDLNSMCIPRMAKQEIGAITKLTKRDGTVVTANTEYNQLGPLLQALGVGGGGGDEADPATGFSPFPGNINQLVVKLPSYVDTLERTGGVMEEFVNPKYADGTKTVFKKPTRLECMMQDYAKVLPNSSSVGFTTSQQWIGYSPAKNSVAEGLNKLKQGVAAMTPSTAEADQYNCTAQCWRQFGCKVGGAAAAAAAAVAPAPKVFAGIPIHNLGPLLSVPPQHSPLVRAHLAQLFPFPEKVVISERSSLKILAPPSVRLIIESLELDGALTLDLHPSSSSSAAAAVAEAAASGGVIEVLVKGLVVRNRGAELVPLSEEELASQEVSEVLRIRGYRLVTHVEATATLSHITDTAGVADSSTTTTRRFILTEASMCVAAFD